MFDMSHQVWDNMPEFGLVYLPWSFDRGGGGGGGGGNPFDAMNFLLSDDRPYGGNWSASSGIITIYESSAEAFFTSCRLIQNSSTWGITPAGSFGTALVNYHDALILQNAVASVSPYGFTFQEDPSLNALKQYLAIVAGESLSIEGEAQGIGSVIMNRLKFVCASILDENFVSKIGGEGQYDAIGDVIYNDVMGDSWEDIFSPGYKYASRISGASTALLSDKDYSYGAYFWNGTYQYFTQCIGFNWNEYNKGTFIITQSIGGTTFFKYKDPNKHWP